MFTNFLDDMRFFQPSARLTRALVSAIEAAHSADLDRVRRDERQVEQDEDDLPEDSFAGVERFDHTSSVSQAESENETLFQQRQIASELFSYLAFQAESPQAKAGHALPIHDSVISGMSVSLGLPEQNSFLQQLASEFCAWLSEQGEFMAGWGRVLYADSDRMYLEEFPAEDLGADDFSEPYASALRSIK
jgi:hypothetical protein